MNKIPKGFKEYICDNPNYDLEIAIPIDVYDKRISILMDWAKHGKHIGSGDIQSLMINGDYDDK
jgi:hypothetical protein